MYYCNHHLDQDPFELEDIVDGKSSFFYNLDMFFNFGEMLVV
jgi:hypothetical protein